MNKSKEVMQDFKKARGGNNVNGVEFNAEILTNSHWPISEVPKCKIPRQMAAVKDQFNMFYKNKFQNREIQWLFNHGQVQIQTTYLNKNYQFVVSAIQASILFLYNENNQLTVQAIMERLDISKDDMKASLMKLCNPKTAVLSKAIKKPTFDQKDEKITLNVKFDSPNVRVILMPQPTAKQMAMGAGGNKTQDDIDNEIQKERSNIIDAVLVRTMKARKVEIHNELVNTVVQQIHLFKAQPLHIKKRIESLIEREYLERDPSNRSKYIYKP
jgi:DNA-binding transcriptional regulator GbsR (MarR family)